MKNINYNDIDTSAFCGKGSHFYLFQEELENTIRLYTACYAKGSEPLDVYCGRVVPLAQWSESLCRDSLIAWLENQKDLGKIDRNLFLALESREVYRHESADYFLRDDTPEALRIAVQTRGLEDVIDTVVTNATDVGFVLCPVDVAEYLRGCLED